MTVQKRCVLEALLDRKDHPTVDQVYEDAVVQIPELTRTTVYRVLESLVVYRHRLNGQLVELPLTHSLN